MSLGFIFLWLKIIRIYVVYFLDNFKVNLVESTTDTFLIPLGNFAKLKEDLIASKLTLYIVSNPKDFSQSLTKQCY